MSETDKPLVWIQGEVKSPPFSAEARLKAGFLLRRLQKGDLIELPDSRPMPSIGKHCHELRINDQNKTWRIIYFIDDDAIVIDRKSTRLNSSHSGESRMPSSA